MSSKYDYRITDRFILEVDYKKKIIFVSENKERPKINPYLKDNFKHLCVIVGANGSGKTSLVQFLLESFESKGTRIKSECIYVYSEGEENYVVVSRKYRDFIVQSDKTRIKRQVFLQATDNDSKESYVHPFFGDTRVVHYSNSLDFLDYQNNLAETIDCSTGSQIKYLIEEAEINRDLNKRNILNNFNVISKLKTIDHLNIAKFINSPFNNEEIFSIKIGRKVTLKVNLPAVKLDHDLDGTRQPYSKIVFKLLNQHLYPVFKNIMDKSRTESFIKQVNVSVLVLFMRSIALNSNRSSYLKEAGKNDDYRIRLKMFGLLNAEEALLKFYDEVEGAKAKFYNKPQTMSAKLKIALNFLNNVGGAVSQFSSTKSSSLLFDFDDPDQFKSFSSILEELNSVIGYNLFTVDFGGMSSGELALTLLLSRIYSHRKIRDLKNDSIYFIDEGDTFFHPEWQRQYFSILTKFLKQITDQDFQLIITTHSPYLLTDVLSQHVLFLNSGAEPKRPSEETYGANLYSIFENGLFVKRPFGEGFYTELRNIIETIKAGLKETTFEEDIQMYHFIKTIGEKMLSKEIERTFAEAIRVNPDKGIGHLAKIRDFNVTN